ncbi:TPA: invasin domain 3-containing protein [Enterobacter cloacae]
MNKIPFALGQAAQVAVLAPNAEGTYANATGGMSVFAGLVLSKRGKPNSVLSLTKENYLDVLGDAIQPHDGKQFEPIRHVTQALNGGNGYVVRVIPDDMRIPVIKLSQTSQVGGQQKATDRSTFRLDKSTARADGVDNIVITFIARDANGDQILAQNPAIKILIANPSGVSTAKTPQFVNGTYTSEFATDTAGTYQFYVEDNYVPITGIAYDVKYTPYTIAAGLSKLYPSDDEVEMDGSTTLYLRARDKNNNPITGLTPQDIGVTMAGQTSVELKQFIEVAAGLYSMVVTPRGLGTTTFSLTQNNTIVSGVTADVKSNPKASQVVNDIDYAASFIRLDKTTATVGDNNKIHFTAIGLNGRPINNLDGQLKAIILVDDNSGSGATDVGVNGGTFVKTGDGIYTANFNSTRAGTATITLSVGGKNVNDIIDSSKPLVKAKYNLSMLIQPKAVAAVQKVAANSPMVVSAPTLIGDGVASVTVTFTAVEENTNLAVNDLIARGLSFKLVDIAKGNAIGSITNITQTGNVYTATVKANQGVVAQGLITASLTSGDISGPNASLSIVAPVVVAVNAAKSQLTVATPGSLTAGASVKIRLVAIDDNDQPVGYLTDLSLKAPAGASVVVDLTDSPASPGTYEAEIKAVAAGTYTFSLWQGNKDLQKTVDVTYVAFNSAFSATDYEFTVSAAQAKADGTETVELKLAPKTGTTTAAVTGKTVTFGYVDPSLTDTDFAFSAVTETNGTYTATVTSTRFNKVEFQPLENGAEIDSSFKAEIEFTPVIGNVSASTSIILDGSDYPEVGDPAFGIGFVARDQDGRLIDGLTGITIRQHKANSSDPDIVTISAVTAQADGLYTVEATPAAVGTAFIEVVDTNQNDRRLVRQLLEVEVYAQGAAPKVSVADATFVAAAGDVYAGDNGIELTLTLTSDKGQPISGQESKVSFKLSNINGSSVEAAKAGTNPGEYVTTFKSTVPSDVTVTPVYDTDEITSKAVTITVAPTVAYPAIIGSGSSKKPNGGKSELIITPAQVPADGQTAKATLTFKAKDGNGKAIENLDVTKLGFPAVTAGSNHGAVEEDPNELGTYTMEFWSTTPGTVTVGVTFDGQDIFETANTKLEKSVEFTAPTAVTPAAPAFSESASKFEAAAATLKNNGVEEVLLTFTAKNDQTPAAAWAATNVEFKALAHDTELDIATPTETAAGSGIWTAKVKTTTPFVEAIEITVTLDNGTYSRKVQLDVVQAEPVGAKSSFATTGERTVMMTANKATFIATVTLKDAGDNAVKGIETKLKQKALAGITLKSAAPTTNDGEYTLTFEATAKGSYTPTLQYDDGKTVTDIVIPTGITLLAVPEVQSVTFTAEATLSSAAGDAKLATLTITPKTAGDVIDEGVTFVANPADADLTNITAKKGAANVWELWANPVTVKTYKVEARIGTHVITTGTLDLDVQNDAPDQSFPGVDPNVIHQVQDDAADYYDFGMAPIPPVSLYAAPVSGSATTFAAGSGSTNVNNSGLVMSKTSVGVGEEVTIDNLSNDVIVIYVDDGDASDNRLLSLTNDLDDPDYWYLTLTEKSSGQLIEQVRFSLIPDDIDDMGLPSYLPIVLENNESRLRAVVKRGFTTFPYQYAGFTNEPFIGGSDGDYDSVDHRHYQKALDTLAASMVNYTAVLGLGCYIPAALEALAQHALDVRVDMFCDIQPGLSGQTALDAARDQGLGAFSHVARYHFPFSSRDPHTRSQVAYGLSGDAFTAKAKGVAMTPDVGGWHYAPAGYTRAILQRANVKPLPGAAAVDREAYVTARINPVTVASDGSVVIDDSLTTYPKNNYLKYQHVNSILNAIARMTYDVCQTLKHEPDGITRDGLEREIPLLLERFVASEALVKPRDTTQGEEPFQVVVKQEDFDLWNIKVFVCPTGVARRIAVEPILFR